MLDVTLIIAKIHITEFNSHAILQQVRKSGNTQNLNQIANF